MLGFTKVSNKIFRVDVWQYSEYTFDSEYETVLNMLGLHKVMNKTFLLLVFIFTTFPF